jgi:excinuclease UvrABC nuclease subunit
MIFTISFVAGWFMHVVSIEYVLANRKNSSTLLFNQRMKRLAPCYNVFFFNKKRASKVMNLSKLQKTHGTFQLFLKKSQFATCI